MAADTNRHVILKSRPGVNGEPCDENFDCVACPDACAPKAEGEVLIRTCYLSVDPALRCMMNEDPGVDYLDAWQPGQPIIGSSGLGVVLNSRHPNYKPGDLVSANLGWPWVQYFTADLIAQSATFQKVDNTLFGDKPSLAVSILVAVTSLIGIWEKGHIKAGGNQTFVVSGAAGACGSLAGQMARLLGCGHVIGICGSDEKCQWLVQDLGFSGAVNYKTEQVEARLRELCPRGIDTYFDNVGGDLSDTVIAQMNPNSHVILCGQVSQYNKDVPYPPPIPISTVETLKDKNITRERFLVLNYPERFQEAVAQTLSWLHAGKLTIRESVTEGLENTGKAFVSMMKGGNIGKQLVCVSDP